jgi:tetratricopeptide (TPR) repeat protein
MELSRQAHPDAQRVEAAVDRILRRAGARPHTDGRGLETPAAPDPHRLFEFEHEVEEISDAIRSLLVSDRAAGLRICRKLYEFAEETMADSYMPLYLYILYRYANALFKTGESHRAAELFEKLCDGTDRMIGIRNTYGIHCLEQLALAAEADGQHEKALAAMETMERIAEEEFGEDSAVAIAVRRFCGRMAAKSL